jgi:hypothetical protein
VPDIRSFTDVFLDQWRKEQEGKPLSLNSTLSAALNKCPGLWMNGICRQLGLSTKGGQKTKVQAIVAHLTDSTKLAAVVAGLPEETREALGVVLEQGGWVKIGTLTRRFGPCDGDGWFWGENPPTSTLGQARVRGLLFIGKAGIGGRNHTVAVVPKELREGLAELLRSET